MTYQTLVKDREMVIPETEMRENIERLFRVMSPSQYPSATKEQLRDVEVYRWHSEDNKNKAGENLGCALIGAERDWPAQAQERYDGFFKDYDNDRVEKRIANSSVLYPGAKLFGAAPHAGFPITINGEHHIWVGQPLTESQSLTQKDQLVPAEVMKRVYDLEHNGFGFKDGYALFSPEAAYETQVSVILNEQIERGKKDLRKMGILAKSAAKLAWDKASSVANSAVNATTAVAGSVAGGVVGIAGATAAFTGAVYDGLSQVQLKDPVITGIIVGSVPKDRRVFFIEIGRWV